MIIKEGPRWSKVYQAEEWIQIGTGEDSTKETTSGRQNRNLNVDEYIHRHSRKLAVGGCTNNRYLENYTNKQKTIILKLCSKGKVIIVLYVGQL